MPKRLVIFDLDGTLLDTIGDLASACNDVLAAHGHPVHTLQQYRMMVGGGISRLIERALPENMRTEEYVERLRGEFIRIYDSRIDELTRPYEGICGLLGALHSRGIAVGVASNKYIDGTRRLVGRFFPDTDFTAVLGQRPGIPVKPDPYIIREIMDIAHAAPSQTLYAGDSGVDMDAAAAAGVESAGVCWGFRSRQELEQHGAAHIINAPSEILGLI